MAEKWLLQILLQAPECLDEVRREISPEHFRCPRRRQFFASVLLVGRCRPVEPTFERLMLEIDDLEMKSLLVELDDERQAMPRGDLQQGAA